MKKVLSLVLALVMALSLCTSAWATGEAGTGEGGTSQAEPVAMVDETPYTDIDEALTKWKDGGTLKLLASCSTAFSGLDDNRDKQFVLDLNGHTLEVKTPLKPWQSTLTVKDTSENGGGKLENKSSYAAIQALVGGRVVIEDGTIESKGYAAIQSVGGFLMTGGKLVGDSCGLYANGGNAEVKTGEINGVYMAAEETTLMLGVAGETDYTKVKITGAVNISSSDTTVNFNSCVVDELTGTMTGTLNFKENAYFVKAPTLGDKGVKSVTKGEATYYQVVDLTEENIVAEIIPAAGEKKSYADAGMAAAALKAGETLKLLKDHTGALAVNAAGDVTVDLNGCNVDGSSVNVSPFAALAVTVADENESHTVTIKNTGEKTATITGSVPLWIDSSRGKPLKVTVGENVILSATEGGVGNGVDLSGGAYLLDNAVTESYFKNGGFMVTVDGEKRIYGTLSAAQAADKNVVLLNNYTTEGTLKIRKEWGSVVLDLNGKTYESTASAGNMFELEDGTTIQFKKGTLKGAAASVIGSMGNNVVLNLEDVTVETTGGYGIATNGEKTSNTVTLKDCKLNVPNGVGIYFPSSGTLTIEDTEIIAKTLGVQVCAGSLNITGSSKIEVTGDAVPKTGGDGAIEDGAAISVVDRDGYEDFGTITISGGTFTAKAGNLALKAYKLSNGVKSDFDNSSDTITISGGTFSSDVCDYVADGKNLRVDSATSYTVVPNSGITSGTYTEKPTVAPGYKAVQNTDGTWRVEKTSGGYYYYPSTPSISAVVNGSNKSATDYTSGSYGLVFRGTASYSSFTGVQVDGKTLAKSNYTVEQNGSGVEVYLKAAYLKTLAAGKHTVTILSTAGDATMDFTIGGKSSSPQTFDAGVGVYAVTAVLSVTGMAWVGRKREN